MPTLIKQSSLFIHTKKDKDWIRQHASLISVLCQGLLSNHMCVCQCDQERLHMAIHTDFSLRKITVLHNSGSQDAQIQFTLAAVQINTITQVLVIKNLWIKVTFNKIETLSARSIWLQVYTCERERERESDALLLTIHSQDTHILFADNQYFLAHQLTLTLINTHSCTLKTILLLLQRDEKDREWSSYSCYKKLADNGIHQSWSSLSNPRIFFCDTIHNTNSPASYHQVLQQTPAHAPSQHIHHRIKNQNFYKAHFSHPFFFGGRVPFFFFGGGGGIAVTGFLVLHCRVNIVDSVFRKNKGANHSLLLSLAMGHVWVRHFCHKVLFSLFASNMMRQTFSLHWM